MRVSLIEGQTQWIQEQSFIPWAFDERLAPYGGDFDVKCSPPSRVYDHDQENVGHRQQAKGLHGKD